MTWMESEGKYRYINKTNSDQVFPVINIIIFLRNLLEVLFKIVFANSNTLTKT